MIVVVVFVAVVVVAVAVVVTVFVVAIGIVTGAVPRDQFCVFLLVFCFVACLSNFVQERVSALSCSNCCFLVLLLFSCFFGLLCLCNCFGVFRLLCVWVGLRCLLFCVASFSVCFRACLSCSSGVVPRCSVACVSHAFAYVSGSLRLLNVAGLLLVCPSLLRIFQISVSLFEIIFFPSVHHSCCPSSVCCVCGVFPIAASFLDRIFVVAFSSWWCS